MFIQHYIISFKDDGQGVNVEAIRHKLESSGRSSRVLNKSEQEVACLIFEDAVSTQDALSLEAGRGMGLSSLAKAVKNANGSIDLNFVKGKGSEFKICLPKQFN